LLPIRRYEQIWKRERLLRIPIKRCWLPAAAGRRLFPPRRQEAGMGALNGRYSFYTPSFYPSPSRGGRSRGLRTSSSQSLHRIGDTGLVNAIEFFGFFCCLQNNFFVFALAELFPNGKKS